MLRQSNRGWNINSQKIVLTFGGSIVCGRPMIKRKGKFGEFLGCTGYGVVGDKCNNTKRI